MTSRHQGAGGSVSEKVQLTPVERAAARAIAERLDSALQPYRGMPHTEITRDRIRAEINQALRVAFDELGSTFDVRFDVISTRNDHVFAVVPGNAKTQALLESLNDDNRKETST
jgi:hypothetical protein